MPPKGLKNIAIPTELWERLVARERPHQAIAGVIEELLLAAEAADAKAKDVNTHTT